MALFRILEASWRSIEIWGQATPAPLDFSPENRLEPRDMGELSMFGKSCGARAGYLTEKPGAPSSGFCVELVQCSNVRLVVAEPTECL